MLRFWIKLRKCSDRQVNKLLKEQCQQWPEAFYVVRSDANIDCMEGIAQLAQVKVAFRRGGIDTRVEPEREACRHRLADALDCIGRTAQVIRQRADRGGAVRRAGIPPGLDHAQQVRCPVVAGEQPQDFPDGQGQLGRFGQERGCANERRAGRVSPKCLIPVRVGKQHLADTLDVIERIQGATAHIRQRVVAGRPAIRRQRIEQEHLLPHCLADAGRCRPVLLFHVQADEGAFVEQAVGNDQAHALAGARGRIAGDMLRPAKPQVAMRAGVADIEAREAGAELLLERALLLPARIPVQVARAAG